jgi:prepilin-type processing-associated H-X9-DG protein
MRREARILPPGAFVTVGCIVLACLTVGAVGGSGRRRAKAIVCQSNLRQWGGIFQGYLERNEGQFFSGAPGTPGYWWPRDLDEEHRNWKQTRIWFCPEATVPMQDEEGRLAAFHPVFTAWGVYETWDLGPNGIAGSYTLNGYCIIPGGQHPPTYYSSGVRIAEGWHDLDAVPDADTVPLFLDALRFDVWPRARDAPPTDELAAWSGNLMARCCINRHDGAVNSLFVDGSVRKVGLKELWTLKWHREFNTGGPWTQAGGVQAGDWPVWMREFRDY